MLSMKSWRLVGILSITDAIRATREKLPIIQAMQDDVQTADPDALVADIMPIAADSPYPLAVVDPDSRLLGIVTKSSVLSSLI